MEVLAMATTRSKPLDELGCHNMGPPSVHGCFGPVFGFWIVMLSKALLEAKKSSLLK